MKTSSAASFPSKFTSVDSLTLAHHWYLKPTDRCFFLGEYTARKGYSFSATNNLIQNLKKPLDRKGKPEWRHKEQAIIMAGRALRSGFKEGALVKPKATIVPVPPSKARGDVLYDDRMLRVLQEMCAGVDADVRELVIQNSSTAAAHETVDRPTPAQIVANYSIDDSVALPVPKLILVTDDVLTTGAHFKAMQQILGSRYPGVEIVGFFIARRVPESSDPASDFEVLS